MLHLTESFFGGYYTILLDYPETSRTDIKLVVLSRL